MEKRNRRYADERERLKMGNRLLLIGLVVAQVMLVLNSIYEIYNASQYIAVHRAIIVMAGVGIAVSVIYFIASPISRRYKWIMVIYYSVIYAIQTMISLEYHVAVFYIVILLAVVVYYTPIYTFVLSGVIGVITTLDMVVTLVVFKQADLVTLSIQAAFMVACAIILRQVTEAIRKFVADMVGAAEDKQEEINMVLQEVLHITSTAEENINEVFRLMGEVNDSTKAVNGAVEEIATGAESVLTRISKQKDMTECIQEDIVDTKSSTNEIVELAEKSMNSLGESQVEFGNMLRQAGEIDEINQNVSVAMHELQEKMKDVNNIIAVIFNVSSQTDLLALNASIEAARAGEVGKGFAVVAGEIRNLAEQTRASTQNVSTIISELNEKAAYAAQIVDSSVEVNDRHTKAIRDITDSMDAVHSDIGILSDNVTVINDKVRKILEANDSIMHHIRRLAAVCEDITANTENSFAVTSQSAELTSTAVMRLKEVVEASEELKKFV